jgi:phosphoglycolate phosphatase
MIKYKAVIFDLDGTLIDTIKDIANSMNRVLVAMELPSHEIAEYYYFVGAGLTELCRRVLPLDMRDEATVLNYRRLFSLDYNDNWSKYTKPYAGINELLLYLQSCNIDIALLSNKPEEFCKLMVVHYFPEIKFSLVKGNVDHIPPKPHPAGGLEIIKALKLSPNEVLFVGDSDIDMQTAINCGFTGIGAEWGFRSKEELEKAGASLTFSSPAKFMKYLKEQA